MLITNTEAYKTAARYITCTLKINNKDYSTYIVDFTKEYAAPKGKFFGFLLPQTLKLKLRGNTENVSKDQRVDITLAVGSTKVYLPWFYITECSYDRNQDITNIVALDRLGYLGNKKATGLTTSNVTLNDIMLQICSLLGMVKKNDIPTAFNYAVTSLNVDGNETYNQYLTAIAEVTGCIGYISQNNEFKFKQLENTTVDTLTTSDYFEFSRGTAVTCRCVTSATELGNNISATDNPTTNAAMVQVIKENMFLTLLDESVILTRLQALYNLYKELSYTPYELKDRGYPGYEPGDQLGVTDPKGTTFIYLLDGKLEYNGGLKGTTSWETNDSVEEPGVNNITEAIKSTYAKVDKANQRIDLVVSNVDETNNSLTQLTLDVNGVKTTVQEQNSKISTIEQTASTITSTVSDLQTDVQGLGGDVNDLKGTVSTVQQTATGLTSTVTQQGQTISEIRQDLDSINLTGYVTFNDLETSGSTTINGSNITTGYISANRLSGGTIDADTINVNNLNAANLTKGLISASRISDASNYLTNLYATNVYTAVNYAQTVQLVASSGAGLENNGTVLKPNGVYLKNGGSATLLATWQQMADGGTTTTKTAVFG